MAYEPETLFNGYHARLGSFERCGMLYYPEFTNVSFFTEIMLTGDFFNVSLGDLDLNRHISMETALQKTILSYPNGVSIVLLAWKVQQTIDNRVYTGIRFKLCNKYNGIVQYYFVSGQGYTNREFGGISYGSQHVSTVNDAAVKRTGVNIFIMCQYPQESAIMDITKMESISFWHVEPYNFYRRSDGELDAFLYGKHFTSNAVIRLQYGTPEYFNFWSDDYYDIVGNFDINGVPYWHGLAYQITDANAYVENAIKALNDDGTVDDIDDIMSPEDRPDEETWEAPQPGEDPDTPGNQGDHSHTGGGTGGGAGYSPPTDPFSPYDPNSQDPSQGSPYTPDSDPVDHPDLPTSGGAFASGSIRTFVVSPAIMRGVFNALWNTSIFDIQTFQKLLEAPLDSMIQLSCIPITPDTNGSGNIQLGNFDTQQSAPYVTKQYYTIDCGSIAVNRMWGSALDYDPYTKIEIYLPFIGIRQLKTEDCMNQKVGVKYNVDILTGEMVATIKCGQSVLYHFDGKGIAQVPVSARASEALSALIRSGFTAAVSGQLVTGALSAAVNVAMSKTHIQRAGNIAGSVSLLDDFIPYLIIHRPMQSLAQNFNTFKGYPSNVTAKLSTLGGYTQIEYINLSVSGATDAELLEIEQTLKEGVII